MNPAHVHLLLNHVLVTGTIVAAVLLAGGIVLRREPLVRTSAVLLVFAALVSAPVYLTGEPTEEMVEHRPEVSEAVIERHKQAAQLAIVPIVAVGVLALVALVAFRRSTGVPWWLAVGMLLLSIGAAGLLVRSARLGGEIRHAEIRRGLDAGTLAPGD
jgi:hypothetical protein